MNNHRINMKQKRTRKRMLAKARGKYGRPFYPGRLQKSVTSYNDKNNKEKEIGTVNRREESKENILAVWGIMKDYLREALSPISFETWIEPCNPVSMTKDRIVLSVENDFIKELIANRYLDRLRTAAEIALRKYHAKVELIVQG